MAPGNQFDPALEEDEGAGKIPIAFGISLAPPVAGALIALLGVGFSAWLATKIVVPAYEENQALKEEIAQKEEEKRKQGDIQKKIEQAELNLASAREQQSGILGLFTDESNLSTLLLDINRQVSARNPDLSPTAVQARLAERGCPAFVRQNYRDVNDRVKGFFARAKLNKFEPVVLAEDARDRNPMNPITDEGYELIQDSSLGPEANGMLKRAVYRVEMQGNFDQTRLFLIQLEQLQPLTIVKDFQSEIEPRSILVNSQGALPGCQPETTLTTSFTLQALLPLTLDELAAQAASEEGEEGEGEEDAEE